MDEQHTLFDLPDGPKIDARLAEMHRAYGVNPGKECGDCQHFHRYKQGTHWSKCDLTRQSGGPATDWRARYTACGRFEDQRD